MAGDNTADSGAFSLVLGTAEDPSDGALFRIILSLIMIATIGFSGYVFYEKGNYILPEVEEKSVRQLPVEDINRLNAMVKELNTANAARVRSVEMAEATASMARYPFVAERTVANIDTQRIEDNLVLPPAVRVKATMFLEGKAAALLDIEEEPVGKIYKVGDRFADKKGRIARIAPEKVTIVYEGKEFICIQ